jgi:hypothetical protein
VSHPWQGGLPGTSCADVVGEWLGELSLIVRLPNKQSIINDKITSLYQVLSQYIVLPKKELLTPPETDFAALWESSGSNSFVKHYHSCYSYSYFKETRPLADRESLQLCNSAIGIFRVEKFPLHNAMGICAADEGVGGLLPFLPQYSRLWHSLKDAYLVALDH